MTITLYNQMLETGVFQHEKVGWGSSESQTKRFEILTQIGDLNSKFILDVGCGLGALGEYLDQEFKGHSYLGIDINEKMVEGARVKNRKNEFISCDVFSDQLLPYFGRIDYSFLSGAFNLGVENQDRLVLDTLERMFEISNIGIAVNFLSNHADHVEPKEFYVSPGRLFDVIASISRKLVLRHDYMPHDVTFYVYK